ncbi:MAG: oligosaccharide flippase family protein [Clostridia bacterium]
MKINRASVFYTASILGISSVILQAIGFIYRIFLTNMAGTEALGVYKLTMQLYSVILSVSTSGVCLVATNRSAMYFSRGKIEKIKTTIKCCVLVFLSILGTCAIIVTAFPEFIATNILGDVRTQDAIYIMLVCILLTGIENIIKNSLIGIKKVKYTTFSEITEQILRVIIVLSLIYNFGDDNYAKIAFLIVLGMTMSEIFSIIFLGVCYKKIYKTDRKNNDKLLCDVVSVAIPISLAAAINNVISSASTVLLPKMLVKAGFTHAEALSELGIISGIAMPLILLPIAIISSYAMVVMPNISKSKASFDTVNITRKINKSFEATGLIGIPATVFLVYLSQPLGKLLFSTEFPKFYIEMIGLSVIFMYYQITSASILNGLGHEKKVVFHSVIGEFVQLAITVLLCQIPSINIYGYIVGMIASPLIVCSLNSTYIFKTERFNFTKFVLNPVFCSGFLYIAIKFSFIISSYYLASEITTIAITVGVGTVFYALILRAFGINYVQYVKNLNIKQNMQFKFK